MGKAPLNYVAEALQTKSDQFHGELVSLSYLQALATGIVNRIEELDRVKKALFYGRPFQPGPHNYDCTHLPTFINGPEGQCQVAVDLIHGIIGKVTESGELLEALLKCMRGDAQLDLVNLAEEIGDGHWYDAIICAALGTSFEQVQQTNIDKLRARFPNKFTEFDANNRDLGIERQILEQQPEEKLIVSLTRNGELVETKYRTDGSVEVKVDDVIRFRTGFFLRDE